MNLSTALLNTARLVGRMYAGNATTTSGAGPTTLVSSTLKSTVDDYFNGGVIFFTSGANAGATRTITDYDNTTRTFTFTPAMANIITTGDAFEVCRDNYSRAELVQSVNQALLEIGDVTAHDDTLTVLDDTEEYTLPAGVNRVRRVEMASDDAAPYGWRRLNYWEESGGSLIFRSGHAPQDADKLLRVWYINAHAYVNADADEVSDYIHPERLAWTAAYYAAFNRSRVVEQEDPILKDLLQAAGARMAEMGARFPVRNMPRDPRYAGW